MAKSREKECRHESVGFIGVYQGFFGNDQAKELAIFECSDCGERTVAQEIRMF